MFAYLFPVVRSVTLQSIDNLPPASEETETANEEMLVCHVCEKKKEKKKADMYCYICNNVYCDNHSGVSVYHFTH